MRLNEHFSFIHISTQSPPVNDWLLKVGADGDGNFCPNKCQDGPPNAKSVWRAITIKLRTFLIEPGANLKITLEIDTPGHFDALAVYPPGVFRA